MSKTTASTKFLGTAFFMLLALSGAVSAQTAERTILRAGKLLDVKSGRVLTNQAIVIDGDKITSVGPASELKSFSNDRVIDQIGRASCRERV